METAVAAFNAELGIPHGGRPLALGLSPGGSSFLVEIHADDVVGLSAQQVFRLGRADVVRWYSLSTGNGEILHAFGAVRPPEQWWNESLVALTAPVSATVWGTQQFRYHDNGRASHMWFEHDRRQSGPSSIFCPDGSLAREEWYRDGARDGPFRAWRAGGTLFVEGEFRRGRTAGKWRFFAPDGRPVPMAALSRTTEGCAWFTLVQSYCEDFLRIEFLQRKEDARPILYWAHGNGIKPTLGHRHRTVFIEEYECSDCYRLVALDLVTGAFRTLNVPWDARVEDSSPDDQLILLRLTHSTRRWNVASSVDGRVLRSFDADAPPRRWWVSPGGGPGR